MFRASTISSKESLLLGSFHSPGYQTSIKLNKFNSFQFIMSPKDEFNRLSTTYHPTALSCSELDTVLGTGRSWPIPQPPRSRKTSPNPLSLFQSSQHLWCFSSFFPSGGRMFLGISVMVITFFSILIVQKSSKTLESSLPG